MLLKSLSFSNYRCFESVESVTLEQITCFIGPNNSGKSSILLLLQYCLQNKPIPSADFRDPKQPIVVDLHFNVSRAHEVDRAQDFMCGQNELRVRKVFTEEKPVTSVFRLCYTNSRLNEYDRYKISELEALISDLDISASPKPKSREDRLELIKEYIAANSPAQTYDWVPVGTELDDILPEFLMFGADEDLTLQTGPLMTTLQAVYRDFLQRESPPELRSLQEQATKHLVSAVAEINPIVSRFAGADTRLIVNPLLDFVRGLNVGEVLVQAGNGDPRTFSRWGDGTKRRIILGLFHWTHKVLGKLAEDKERSLLWCFDEPDTHLYYRAQHELLTIIKDMAADRMQVVLCTHSLMLIDRLSPKSVRHMLPNPETGCTQVEWLDQDFDGEDIDTFLKSVGSGVGFSNSLLFYERCFLIVEGPTEEKALPILYRMLHDEDLIERGLRLFAAESNTAAVQLARLLHRQKKRLVLLLDSDSKTSIASHIERLASDGFDVNANVVYIGAAEFEDAFSNEALLHCLTTRYERADEQTWSESDLQAIRDGKGKTGKFSEDLRATVGKASKKNVSKPEFARQLAQSLADKGDHSLIPRELQDLFELMRDLVDSENEGDANPEDYDAHGLLGSEP